jgi:hypothetical protein
MKKKSTEHSIDAVILWVDGNDEKHQLKMLPYLENKEVIKTKKFENRFTQVNEIKYTVESILKFAPYIRNIFIITDNQTPEFLMKNKNDFEKVIIIDHKVIFKGFEEFLPTFNSRTIESFMFRIPNLSEHFIYLNDDFFLINPTKPEDFFIDWQPVLRGKWLKFDSDKFYKKNKKNKVGHKTAQQLSAKIAGSLKYYNFKHTPHPLRKSKFESFFKNNRELILSNIQYKFRSNKQFLFQGVINHLEINNKTCVLKKDLQLSYLRSYKKPLIWYKYKFEKKSEKKLFLGLQNLSNSKPKILEYILGWLKKRILNS